MAFSQSTKFYVVEDELKSAQNTWTKLEANQQKQLQVCEDEIDNLKKKFKDAEHSSDRKIKLLKKELLKRKKRLEELQNAVKDELSPINPEEHRKLQEECLHLKQQSDEKSRLLQAYKHRIRTFQEIIGKIKEQHSSSMKNEEAKQNNLERKLKRMKMKMNEKGHQEKIASLESDIAALKQENNNLRSEQDKSRNWKEELELTKAKFAKMESHQKDLEEKNQDYRVKVKTLEEQLALKDIEDNNLYNEKLKMLTHNITELEAKNANIKEQLEKSEKRYQNLLILPGGREELLAENERMKNRLDVIEENFDEAWAGFRLEILRYETNLEKMEDQIETMKAKKDGKVYKRIKPRFQETDSGSFCLLAMKELGKLLHFGERSRDYLDALEELGFYASSLPKERKKQLVTNKDEDKDKSYGTEEKQEFSYDDDFEEDDVEESTCSDPNVTNQNPDGSTKQKTNSEVGTHTSLANSGNTSFTTESVNDFPKHLSSLRIEEKPTNSCQGNIGCDNDDKESVDEEIEEEIFEEVDDEEMSNENEDEIFLPIDPSTIVVVGVCKDPTLKSILKHDGKKVKMTMKRKSIKFNNIVDFQFIDDNNTVSDGDFVDVLKPPHEKWEIPKVSVLDNPQHTLSEPVIPSSFKYPTLRNIPTSVESNSNDKDKITAADIFGNNSGNYDDDDVDNDDEFDDLDDAIDFILNM